MKRKKKAEGLIFTRERLTCGLAEALKPLQQEHHAEVSPLQNFKLLVDWSTYDSLQAAGCLHIFTARDRGKLAGYAIYIVSRDPHYSVNCATQDALFLLPAFRRGLAGKRLIAYSEAELKKGGTGMIIQHSMNGRDLTGLLSRLGYQPIGTIFQKMI